MNYLLTGVLILLVIFAIVLILKLLKKSNDEIIKEKVLEKFKGSD